VSSLASWLSSPWRLQHGSSLPRARTKCMLPPLPPRQSFGSCTDFTSLQALALLPHPHHCQLLPHVGGYIPRATPPAHRAATVGPTQGVHPPLAWIFRGGKTGSETGVRRGPYSAACCTNTHGIPDREMQGGVMRREAGILRVFDISHLGWLRTVHQADSAPLTEAGQYNTVASYHTRN
jgi:hypothetical protein